MADEKAIVKGKAVALMEKCVNTARVPFAIDDVKKNLFQIMAADVEEAMKGGQEFHVLEISPEVNKDFHNYKFYPSGIKVTIIDHVSLDDHVASLRDKYPDIVFEKYITGDAENMDEIPDGSFDAVIAAGVACEFNDNDAAVKGIRRVLKPGGKLFLSQFLYEGNNDYGADTSKLDAVIISLKENCMSMNYSGDPQNAVLNSVNVEFFSGVAVKQAD